MAAYRIKDRSEEFDCPTCGEPRYTGETAYEGPTQ